MSAAVPRSRPAQAFGRVSALTLPGARLREAHGALGKRPEPGGDKAPKDKAQTSAGLSGAQRAPAGCGAGSSVSGPRVCPCRGLQHRVCPYRGLQHRIRAGRSGPDAAPPLRERAPAGGGAGARGGRGPRMRGGWRGASANGGAGRWARPRPRRGEGQGDGAGPAFSLCRSGSILRGELGLLPARPSPLPARHRARPRPRGGGAASRGAGAGLGGRAVAGIPGPTSLCSCRPPQVAMFSSIAPLARHNPFYAPHFQLLQDGVRRRPAEPAAAPATRRGLAAASADEGEGGTEGPSRRRGRPRRCAGLAVSALPPQGREQGNASARPGREGPGLGLGLRPLGGRGRARAGEALAVPPLPWRGVLRTGRDPGLPGRDTGTF